MGSTDDDERAAALVALHGHYGVHPDTEPAAAALPAVARWLLGGLVAVVVLGVLVWALVAEGASLVDTAVPGDGLDGVPWEVLLLVGACFRLVRWVRSGAPHTEVGGDGLVVSSGRGRRRIGWHDVAAVVPARRFAWWPTAVLTDGTRVELPGVPPEVAARLAEVLGAATRQPPPARSRDDDADGGWDGPFRTGSSGG
ncbi:PH domain-containing protein [Streptomyces sp. NP160]|uniref:PH domain-containing protein n=1 Tax=Streptomyces sp. NP160 TaxID=2586637 RepID=UPI001117BA1C|nr:PH domain-containing protein [Streptomyces sp. NP160]TNM58379.1 PH domain-containing protein [Streptomyces sp. NP160]